MSGKPEKRLISAIASLLLAAQAFPVFVYAQAGLNQPLTSSPAVTPVASGNASNTPLSAEPALMNGGAFKGVTGVVSSGGVSGFVASSFSSAELQNLIASRYFRFAEDPAFIRRVEVINRNNMDFPGREFLVKAFEDEQKSFVTQRHRDFVLFLENYLVKNNLPNMTDVAEFVDKIEEKYFYFEKKTYGSSCPGDKNYYRAMLETTVTENEPAFSQFARSFIKDSEIKRKKYFSNKVNDYFYETHLKEGVNYDKKLQDAVTNDLIEVFATDSAYPSKYSTPAYEKFFADKALQADVCARATSSSIESFRKRISQTILPALVQLQGGGTQVLTRDNYEKLSSQLTAVLTTPAFVFSNRNASDTEIICKVLSSVMLKQNDDQASVSTKVYLQALFASSKRQIVNDSVAAVQAGLTQSNWDRAISAFIQASEHDPALQEKLDRAIVQTYLKVNRPNAIPLLVDPKSQLEGADGEKTVSLLQENIRDLFDAWDVDVFRESLKNDLLKEVFFPGKEQFVGNSPEANARFQLLSFLAMYNVYYANNKGASERLEQLLATPLQRHRQVVFESPGNRKLAVKEFRKMVRSNEGAVIGKATFNELVTATAVAARTYTNPTSMPATSTLILKALAATIPAVAGLTITSQPNWKTLMTQITSICIKKSTTTILQTPSPPPSPSPGVLAPKTSSAATGQ